MRACDVKRAEKRTDSRGPTAEAARRAGPAWRGQGRLSWLWGPGERLGSPRAVTTGRGSSSWPGSSTRSQGGVWAQPPSLRLPVLPHPPLESEERAARASLPAETFTQAGCWSTSVPEASSPAPCPVQGPPAQLPGGAGPGGPAPRQCPPRDGPQGAMCPLQSRGPGRAASDATTRQREAPSGTGVSSSHAALQRGEG